MPLIVEGVDCQQHFVRVPLFAALVLAESSLSRAIEEGRRIVWMTRFTTGGSAAM